MKVSYIDTVELYSAIMKSYIMKFAGKWMYLENIILMKVIKSQRGKKEVMGSSRPITDTHVFMSDSKVDEV